MARCLLVGGAEQSWLVARSKESVVRLESSAALLCDALSFSIPIRRVSFVMLHEQKHRHLWRMMSKNLDKGAFGFGPVVGYDIM